MSQTAFVSTVQGNSACVAAAWAAHESALKGYLRDRLRTACQVRFDDDGSVGGHVPRPDPAG